MGGTRKNEFTGKDEPYLEGRTVFDVRTFPSELFNSLIAHMGDGSSRKSMEKYVSRFSNDPKLTWPPSEPIAGTTTMAQRTWLGKKLKAFLEFQPAFSSKTGSGIRQISYQCLFNEIESWFPKEKDKPKIWEAVGFALTNHQKQSEVGSLMRKLQKPVRQSGEPNKKKPAYA